MATSNGQGLPVDTFREAAPFLRRPFTAAAVRFRILTTRGDRSRCAAYIDARLAIERLNTVIPHKWEHDFVPVQGGMMCALTVCGMQRRDVGWSKGTGSDMDLKALYSDAFKRAAVHFGIGVSLYAVPNLYIDARQGQARTSGNATYMTDGGEAFLRKVYSKWLDDHGRQAFGEPLDHGDVDDEAVAA